MDIDSNNNNIHIEQEQKQNEIPNVNLPIVNNKNDFQVSNINSTITQSQSKKNKKKKNKKKDTTTTTKIEKKKIVKKNSIVTIGVYKQYSPFQKYLDLGKCPSIEDLYTEFYHIIKDSCELLSVDLDKANQELKAQQRLLKNSDKSSDKSSNNKNVQKQRLFREQTHYHSREEMDGITIDCKDRDTIELIVRKICGFLSKERNMVLVEMILLSCSLSKSLEFLQLALDIETKGGITITIAKDRQGNPITPMQRKKTPGGIFFKLISMHLDTQHRAMIFTQAAIHQYSKERHRQGFGKLPNCSGLLPSATTIEGRHLLDNLDSELYNIDDHFESLSINDNSSQ
ncbi:hypothetical protein DLAC_08993 [Tieghemostelium lacteum]|uniref:Phosphorylated adapter RNA export protein RNA-binding domain-containing protein n=1 Tax=Tieghemostelium lacteum TaxID=361077 RepID=A0A151Z8U2_TIELA|nr:hypothetical protein DLAC_08993 [Tieghemostelium lacteum]|eukprot:KYQ90375.1 hypothetical protein DLAC_08993 [Tieghemostelium lacteum]